MSGRTLVRRPRHAVAERPIIVIWEATRARPLACLHFRADAQPDRDPGRRQAPHRHARRGGRRRGRRVPDGAAARGGRARPAPDRPGARAGDRVDAGLAAAERGLDRAGVPG
ncbi:hypothetical protein GCM10010388_53130 [Streptomyces mauvecolor]